MTRTHDLEDLIDYADLEVTEEFSGEEALMICRALTRYYDHAPQGDRPAVSDLLDRIQDMVREAENQWAEDNGVHEISVAEDNRLLKSDLL